jgi:lipoate-protein ligase A
MNWRLLVDGPHDGAWNMAADEALAEAVDAGASRPVLRLYRWQPLCLSLGFSQPFEVADAIYCTWNGIDIVRRPTGGRAVLHDVEMTYAVAAPLAVGPFPADLQECYRTICLALIAGLRQLGVVAELAGEPEGGHVRPTEAIPCFIGPAAGEVVVVGRKLIGSAMRKIGNSILQHGSLLEDWDNDLQAGCVGLADGAALRAAVITLRDLLGSVPGSDSVANAIAQGFEERFGITFERSQLTEQEQARAMLLARERYGNERWTVRRDASLQ